MTPERRRRVPLLLRHIGSRLALRAERALHRSLVPVDVASVGVDDVNRADDGDFDVVLLAGGQRLRLRRQAPSDEPDLRLTFARLSLRSRALRFLVAVNELSPETWRQLLDVDGYDHVSIVARVEGHDGIVGVGRWIRTSPGGDEAELALTVIDAWQGRGIGRVLLERLIAAAQEAGVARFVAETAVDNAAVQRLLAAHNARHVGGDGAVDRFEMPCH